MERLTDIEVIGGKVHPVPKLELQSTSGFEKIVCRLSDIEDILGDTYDLDRLRELVEAEKAGKNFVSPCKIGDTVYIVHYGKCPHLNSATVSGIHLRDETYRGGKKRREYVVVRKNGFSKHLPIDRIGKMWFLHADSAESALAKEADHE